MIHRDSSGLTRKRSQWEKTSVGLIQITQQIDVTAVSEHSLHWRELRYEPFYRTSVGPSLR